MRMAKRRRRRRHPGAPTCSSIHGDERVDDWYWLRDRDDPDVLAHLEAENAYTEAVLRHAALRDRIFEEIRSRVQETDDSGAGARRPVGVLHDRTDRGAAVRDPLPAAARAAAPNRWCSTRTSSPRATTTSRWAASRCRPTTASSRTRPTSPAASATRCGSATSTAASTSTTSSTTSLRPRLGRRRTHQLLRAARRRDAPERGVAPPLGTTRRPTTCSCSAKTTSASTSTSDARGGRFVLIESSSKLTSETWFVPTATPDAAPRVVAPREHGARVHGRAPRTDGADDRFLIVTNANGAQNFELVAAPVAAPGRDELDGARSPPHRRAARRRRRVRRSPRAERTADGLDRLRVTGVSGEAIATLPASDPVYSMWVGPNPEFDTRHSATATRRWSRPSPTRLRPRHARASTRREGAAGARRLRPGAIHVGAAVGDGGRRRPSPDLGRAPPRRRARRRRAGPALGYGAYEHSIDPVFRASRLSLLDRGFVFAIAHVRGGGELGRAWYEQRQARAQGEHVHRLRRVRRGPRRESYTVTERLVARGGSAGGLLMGAVANLRPDLFAASSRRCRSSTSSPRCWTRTFRSPSPSGRSGATPRTGGVRAHEGVLAVRQRRRAAVPDDARHQRPQRSTRAVLGTGQVGGEAARATRRRAHRSCCAPSWVRATAARRAATTRGATKRSCSSFVCSAIGVERVNTKAHRSPSRSAPPTASRSKRELAPPRRRPRRPARSCCATRTRSSAGRCAAS